MKDKNTHPTPPASSPFSTLNENLRTLRPPLAPLVTELNDKLHALLRLTNYVEMENRFNFIQKLTVHEISIISLVARNPDIILREISEQMHMPKTTLTSIINRLEDRNYIKRVTNDKDKRSFRIELTEVGKLAQEEHLRLQTSVCERLLGSLRTDEDKKLLLELLDKIIHSLTTQLK